MLRIVQNTSAAGAKSYFSTSDYYAPGQQELKGVWRGKGAERLGLSGTIEKEAWEALCDNRNPVTGEKLTARQKSERRIGYDINFHVPKSVSLLYGITGDDRILDAFRDSVNETMGDMEAETKTRVRKGGKNEDRVTGEMVWGEHVHFTARPIDGVPDPHLHAHCFVMNTTFDTTENRWKAMQIADIKRDAPLFEARFHSRMARKMAELGLAVARTKRGWEIEGVSASTIEKFSRRTALIEALAAEKGITNPREKSELGAKTRQRKQKDLTMDELRRVWRERLSDEERSGIAETAERLGSAPHKENLKAAEHAAKLAVEHCFERKSVVPERTLLAEALKRSYGEVSVEATERAVSKQDIILGEKDGRQFATTRTVLAEEQRMIDWARAGRGACARLGSESHQFKRDWLNEEQRRAVVHVLESTDRVILVRGVAGSGKTTMLTEAVEAIEANGVKVFAFAPSAEASRGVLRDAGFSEADTVARLLKDEKMQERIRGDVILVDEASLMGSRTMGQLFDLADRLNARVLLSGDKKQHSAIERGAALRLLETEAGVVPAEIKNIQRQKAEYRDAVKALADGNTEKGFETLDRLGWIREAAHDERYSLLARDYVAALKKGKSALVVSPTHREGERVTTEIRAELKRTPRSNKHPKQSVLGNDDRKFPVLRDAQLTASERADPVYYKPGDMILFHQNATGFRKGDRVIAGKAPLPLEQADRFTAFRAAALSLASGDQLRITHNGKTKDGKHRLNNGAIYTVKNFTASGDIRLTNGWTIDKNFMHLAHGYAVTSQASQGKTVDRVFIGISSSSFPAASREGFYVAASRAREMASIYTDDKASLLEAVSKTDDKLSATEFLSSREHRERGEAIRRMEVRRQAERESARPMREREAMNYER
jgi:conjugative relaxase-like TrwC/TraI family protein